MGGGAHHRRGLGGLRPFVGQREHRQQGHGRGACRGRERRTYRTRRTGDPARQRRLVRGRKRLHDLHLFGKDHAGRDRKALRGDGRESLARALHARHFGRRPVAHAQRGGDEAFYPFAIFCGQYAPCRRLGQGERRFGGESADKRSRLLSLAAHDAGRAKRGGREREHGQGLFRRILLYRRRELYAARGRERLRIFSRGSRQRGRRGRAAARPFPHSRHHARRLCARSRSGRIARAELRARATERRHDRLHGRQRPRTRRGDPRKQVQTERRGGQ